MGRFPAVAGPRYHSLEFPVKNHPGKGFGLGRVCLPTAHGALESTLRDIEHVQGSHESIRLSQHHIEHPLCQGATDKGFESVVFSIFPGRWAGGQVPFAGQFRQQRAPKGPVRIWRDTWR